MAGVEGMSSRKRASRSNAEDAASGVGGFHCVHCGAKFKTLQALGGHKSIYSGKKRMSRVYPTPTFAPDVALGTASNLAASLDPGRSWAKRFCSGSRSQNPCSSVSGLSSSSRPAPPSAPAPAPAEASKGSGRVEALFPATKGVNGDWEPPLHLSALAAPRAASLSSLLLYRQHKRHQTQALERELLKQHLEASSSVPKKKPVPLTARSYLMKDKEAAHLTTNVPKDAEMVVPHNSALTAALDYLTTNSVASPVPSPAAIAIPLLSFFQDRTTTINPVLQSDSTALLSKVSSQSLHESNLHPGSQPGLSSQPGSIPQAEVSKAALDLCVQARSPFQFFAPRTLPASLAAHSEATSGVPRAAAEEGHSIGLQQHVAPLDSAAPRSRQCAFVEPDLKPTASHSSYSEAPATPQPATPESSEITCTVHDLDSMPEGAVDGRACALLQLLPLDLSMSSCNGVKGEDSPPCSRVDCLEIPPAAMSFIPQRVLSSERWSSPLRMVEARGIAPSLRGDPLPLTPSLDLSLRLGTL